VITRTLETTPAGRRTGRRGRWPSSGACRSRRCRGSGGPSRWLRTVKIAGRRVRTRCSLTKSATWSGSISTRGKRRQWASWRTKSQIPALDRTTPIFLVMPGTLARATRRTHPAARELNADIRAWIKSWNLDSIGSAAIRPRVRRIRRQVQRGGPQCGRRSGATPAAG
jgi:hypothetical protein